MQTAAQSEELSAQLDLFTMFKTVARESGVKNVDEFVRRKIQNSAGANVEVREDDAVRELIAGRGGVSVPLGGNGGANL